MEEKINIQFAESLLADFEENTWTFEMNEDFSVTAGEFAIVPKYFMNELIAALNDLASEAEEIYGKKAYEWGALQYAKSVINKALGKEDKE